MKYTKGKWGIIDRGGKIIIAVNADNPIKQENIAVLYGYAEDVEVKANAKLISEAPETKAKLQRAEAQRDELLKLVEEVEKHHQGKHSAIGFKLRQAIKNCKK